VRSRNDFNSGKAKNITYSEFVLEALGIQYEEIMRRTVPAASLLIPYFITLPQKRKDLRK
jgi:hypothetical protein